ncbi:chaperonin 10-like protein [Jimgerdemannia flammicorona]|uniref:Chaperonin 10-like protein n=1 Tax=Jimgerdemannia flammicorona TaxID=994334 RepID=A0A433QNJ4_9FUNG|nr:chaperonin 10-like protein [Jimgerdemannia flammicorona]
MSDLETSLPLTPSNMAHQGEQFHAWAALQKYVHSDESTKLVPWSFTPRPLNDDDVEIKITHCGICGTDIHQLTNVSTIQSQLLLLPEISMLLTLPPSLQGWNRAVYPLVPGHEFVGHVTHLGSSVTHLKQGDRVGVSPVCASCGGCGLCAGGHAQLCADKVTTYNGTYKGFQTYGGYADRVRVQAKWAVRIPDAIGSDEAAPLLCAGITTYTPFKHHNIGANTRVGIVGIGGLGHLAVQWARAKSCRRILVISSSDSKRAESTTLGATGFITLSDPNLNALPTSPLAKSLDVLFVTGSSATIPWAALLNLVDNLGKVVLLDLPEVPISLPAASLIYRHISLVGSFTGSTEDLEEMLTFAAEKGVRPWIKKVPMAEVNKGVDMVIKGGVRYRVVLVKDGAEN